MSNVAVYLLNFGTEQHRDQRWLREAMKFEMQPHASVAVDGPLTILQLIIDHFHLFCIPVQR